MLLWRLGQGRQDSGWIREGGWAHLGSQWGSPLSSSPGPAPDFLTAAPAAGASSSSGSAAIYGARMGRRGAAAPAPPPLHRLVGREKRGGAGTLPGREPQNYGGGRAGGRSKAGPPQTQ